MDSCYKEHWYKLSLQWTLVIKSTDITHSLQWTHVIKSTDITNSHYSGLLFNLTLTRPGFFGCSVAGGGGWINPPPWDLGRRSRNHHENWHIRYLWRNLPNYKKKNIEICIFFFILINNANLCVKSYILL